MTSLSVAWECEFLSMLTEWRHAQVRAVFLLLYTTHADFDLLIIMVSLKKSGLFSDIFDFSTFVSGNMEIKKYFTTGVTLTMTYFFLEIFQSNIS